MEDLMKDKRFAHISKDPKFRRIPKSERKIKIDKRFRSMFEDERFCVKYTVDKRGRPVNETSSENLRKYYELSSGEEDSSEDEDPYKDSSFSKKTSDLEECKSQNRLSKKNKEFHNLNSNKGKNRQVDLEKDNLEFSNSDEDAISSNGNLLRLKPESESEQSSLIENYKKSQEPNESKSNEKDVLSNKSESEVLSVDIKKKLQDLTVDYARGEGVLLSDSSSDDESSTEASEDEKVEHNWGELDKEAETTDEISSRLAACNMDWDRIRAVDLMVLFHSFLPPTGLIHSVSIYPSEFGLKRMKEEEIRGPTELVESEAKNSDEDLNSDDEDSNYQKEKLRQYQLNRLKYYYAVIDFDSAETANKVYTECDGIEYESSATKLDLRFIPSNMTFDQNQKEVCNQLPDMSKYKPRQFCTTALQQVKVDLTWDETDPDRIEFNQKVNSAKPDEISKNDLQAYLASGSSDEEIEDEVKKVIEKNKDIECDKDPVEKYKMLLKSIEDAEEEKRNKEVELEFTWGVGEKEKHEKLAEESLKKSENLTPFEKYLEKRKEKKKARKNKKEIKSQNMHNGSDSDDSLPSDIDLNDPYFASEIANSKSKQKKIKSLDQVSDEEDKKRQAELELLLMEKEDEDGKSHFNMKEIEKTDSLTKSKKKRLKKKKENNDEKPVPEFNVDVDDPRFSALFTSHHFNIDPTDPHFRKTKGTEILINEKLKRRKLIDEEEKSRRYTGHGRERRTPQTIICSSSLASPRTTISLRHSLFSRPKAKPIQEEKYKKSIGMSSDLIALVKSVKSKTKDIKKRIK